MSSKLKIGTIVALIVGFAVFFQMQQMRITRLMAENSDLRSQLGQVASLQEINERLAEQLKGTIAWSQTNQSELLRLRGQGLKLRQLEQENAQLKAQHQQAARQIQESQAAAIPSEPGHVTAVTEQNASSATPTLTTTDLGALELQHGVVVQFDLGGGTNCLITPTALEDGNNSVQIRMGLTNTDGTFSELGAAKITARPGQPCSISVGDRMIALAVTVKRQ